MKRLKRSAVLLIIGFLAFAPPGTMIFGLTFVLGLTGYFLNRDHSVEYNPQLSAISSPTLNTTNLHATAKPKSLNELPVYLESFLPLEASGKVYIAGKRAFLAFTIADEVSLKEKARKYARDFIFAAYDTDLPLEAVQIVINQRDGKAGLSLTLGATVAATQSKSTWSDQNVAPTTFINWMKEADRFHSGAESPDSVRITGSWAE